MKTPREDKTSNQLFNILTGEKKLFHIHTPEVIFAARSQLLSIWQSSIGRNEEGIGKGST